MAVAIAVSSEVEGQYVQTQIVEYREESRRMAAIAAMSVAENEIPSWMWVGDEPSGELDTIGSTKADILESQPEGSRRPLGDRVKRMQGSNNRDEEDKQRKQNTPQPQADSARVSQGKNSFNEKGDETDYQPAVGCFAKRDDA
jgi:hypothetical protein